MGGRPALQRQQLTAGVGQAGQQVDGSGRQGGIKIGDMPLGLQAKILRVLQEKEFDRVGGTRTVQVDVRIICATNQDLAKMVREGAFREDLYYRINVFALQLPALRERKEDIPLLVDDFLVRTTPEVRVSSAALQMMIGYAWPGNVRELQNTVERAALSC